MSHPDDLAALQAALSALGARDAVDPASGRVALDSIRGDDARREALALALSTPSVRSLSLRVDPRRTPDLDVSHRSLTSLSISLEPRPATESFALSGSLPRLASLSLRHRGQCRVAVEPLRALVASASSTLRSVALLAPSGWATLAALAPSLGLGGAVVCASHPPGWSAASVGASEVSSDDPARAADWAHLLTVRSAGCAIDPWSAWWLVDRPERFAALEEALRRSTVFLPLDGSLHGFLLRHPARLAGFDRVETARVFGADGLSSDGLATLVASLPRLRALEVFNSHDPALDCLSLRSPTLEAARFVHAHCLRSYALDCPRLTSLTLDTCDGETADPHLDGGDGARCRGNLLERLLRDLLDGAPTLRLPALAALALGHAPQTTGTAPVYEALRVDVACTRGHPTLASLSLSHASHLRSLTLRALPALREVRLCDEPRSPDAPTWLEAIDVGGLDPRCALELPPTGPRRAALPAFPSTVRSNPADPT